MLKILNIVNGDVAIDIMKKGNINGHFLPWRDFLHEGPVPQKDDISQLSTIRASFIHQQGFGKLQELEEDFQARDQVLKHYHKYHKIILWFEHDLYDQLQLIQILAWFEKNAKESVKLTLISTEQYIGECSIQDISKLLYYEKTITKEHLELAKKAWFAFSSPAPLKWFDLLKIDLSLMPFLKKSVQRMLEEYPNSKNGLSRSEHQALLVISKGVNNPKEIFREAQNYEKEKFMGDIIFWKILDNFIEYKLIYSQKNGQILEITEFGEKILEGELHWLQLKDIDRWIGGVHLEKNNLWCWDIQKQHINKYYYSQALKSLLYIKN